MKRAAPAFFQKKNIYIFFLSVARIDYSFSIRTCMCISRLVTLLKTSLAKRMFKQTVKLDPVSLNLSIILNINYKICDIISDSLSWVQSIDSSIVFDWIKSLRTHKET